MNKHYYAVIMAGGGGTRMWPLSRRARPKQLLHLFENRSMFQSAVDRLEGLFPPDRILVVTVAEQASLLQAQAPQIPVENYLLEPLPRGTASVVGMAAAVLAQRDSAAVMAVLTADHFIGNVANFRKLLSSAFALAHRGYLVTIGIPPSYPATGYGYIEMGELLESHQNNDVFEVLRFTEKPDDQKAQEFLATGNHVWNSGMFVWRNDQILSEFKRQMPHLFEGITALTEAWGKPRASEVLDAVWSGLKSETIDYGIMEGAERMAIIPAHELDWSDVGSWESLFGIMPIDEKGNIFRTSDHLEFETRNTLIYDDRDERLIVTIGVEDLIIVETVDVLLICHKKNAQNVRNVVNMLKEAKKDWLL